MAQINLQIRVPEEFIRQMEAVSALSRSDFVREAIAEKLGKIQADRMEQQWIKALANPPPSQEEAEAWHKAEAWE